MPTFNSYTKFIASPGIIHDHTLIADLFPGHGCTDNPMTKRSFYSQARWVINVLGLFF